MVQIISIEGGIGAGKTTFIDNLFKHPDAKNFILVPEPVDSWLEIKNQQGENILQAFYKDRKENALPLQLVALFTRRELILKKIEEAKKLEQEIGKTVYLITERTVRSDYYIFANSLHRDGYINEFGMIAYIMWNNIFSKESEVNKTVYIRVLPNQCKERIMKRGRSGEENIDMDYLNELHEAHEKMFNEELKNEDHYIFHNEHEIETQNYNDELTNIVNYILI